MRNLFWPHLPLLSVSSYPDFGSGFFLSMPLIKTLVPRWNKERQGHMDFAIDPKHELAMFIWNQGKGVSLQVRYSEIGANDNKSSKCKCIHMKKQV